MNRPTTNRNENPKMDERLQADDLTGKGSKKPRSIYKTKVLYRGIWRNWLLLSAVFFFATIALAAALFSLLSPGNATVWPWSKTESALLVGLSIVLALFVAYLTGQQRRLMTMTRDFLALKQESLDLIHHHKARLNALANVTRLIGVETDLQCIFDRITEMCVATFGCSRASLMIHDPKTDELVVKSVSGHSEMDLMNLRQRVGEGIAGHVARHREPMILSDPAASSQQTELGLRDPSLTSAMVVPIVVRDELVGVLNVSSNSRDVVFDANDLLVLQGLAASAGACIRHSEHISWMRRMVPQLAENEHCIHSGER